MVTKYRVSSWWRIWTGIFETAKHVVGQLALSAVLVHQGGYEVVNRGGRIVDDRGAVVLWPLTPCLLILGDF